MAEIQAEMMADWTTDDTHSVDINKEAEPGQAKGALKNPASQTRLNLASLGPDP